MSDKESKENSVIEQIKQSKLKEQSSSAILSAAEYANKQFNQMLSSMAQPIYDVIEKFKPIPTKLRSTVDIQGASNKLYDKCQDLSKSYQMFLEKVIIEEEVPITLIDYNCDPSLYPDLLDMEMEKGEVTEQDCEDSGYTITIQTIDPQWHKKLLEFFLKPEDRDIVAIQMEKLINTTIKTTWNTLKPAVSTLGQIAPIDPINTMMDSVIESIDGIVKVASTTIPEDKLNEMIAKKQSSEQKNSAEAKTATEKQNNNGKSVGQLAKQLMDSSTDSIKQVGEGIKDGVTDAFKNLKAPEIPQDVKDTIAEMKDAVIYVKDNLSNIYTVIILKMMGQIVDCFNQVVDALGVPTIPDPLGKIQQLVQDAQKIHEFVTGLPQSLISVMESIFTRKMKMIQVAQTPIPTEPLKDVVSLPSTSDDVTYPKMYT